MTNRIETINYYAVKYGKVWYAFSKDDNTLQGEATTRKYIINKLNSLEYSRLLEAER